MSSLERARRLLSRRFGHADFRPLQRRVVEAMLEGRDVVAVLPTGYGKSACFQVPSALQPGTTVVVSPLISLIEDQVGRARARGFHAFGWTSGAEGIDRALARAESGHLELLYVSPERLGQRRTRERLRGLRIARLAVDEAHCVSEWGHEFRPSYLVVGGARRALGMPPLAAFTATATAATRRDLETLLSIARPVRVVAPVDRENLRWRVERVGRLGAAFALVVESLARSTGPAIVYTPTRALSARAAIGLSRHGFSAAAYHAGLPIARRSETQRRFLDDEIRVVCATSAFGMGIDHPHVRLVAHLGAPRSTEQYVQEAGRAGRDGQPSDCLLVSVKRRDRPLGSRLREIRRRLREGGECGDGRGRVRRRAMRRYVNTRACRRAAIAAYFGERPPACAGCDNCHAGVRYPTDRRLSSSWYPRTGRR